MIQPTVGRVVHFYEDGNASPQAAVISEVHGDRCVNLGIFTHGGAPMQDPPTSVHLVQPDEPSPESGCFCTWMPYQIKKDHGSESGERAAGEQQI